MDESWRLPIGTIIPRQRSIEDKVPRTLGPEDFRDVFGGPPQKVLIEHFSASGNALLGSEGMLEDVSLEDWPLRLTKSSSNSSSVLRSEDVSTLGTIIDEDAKLSLFSSKLRPVSIPPRSTGSWFPSMASDGEPVSSPFKDFYNSSNRETTASSSSSSSKLALLLRQQQSNTEPHHLSPTNDQGLEQSIFQYSGKSDVDSPATRLSLPSFKWGRMK